MTKDSKQWTTVFIDTGTADAFIVFPDDLLELMVWGECDELNVEIDDNLIKFTKIL
jgi:hypothetical protein